jgi:hypothetical protein
MALANYNSIINPRVVVQADGWHSTIGELTQYGWTIELAEDPYVRSHQLYMRNPSKGMVGRCMLTDEYLQVFPMLNGKPICYMDERLLIRAEMYQEMRVPRAEIYPVQVGELKQYPHQELCESDWIIYSSTAEAPEIIVTPEKVPMLLEAIREAQEPRAKELLHSQRKRELRELETKAKILTFAAA